MLWVGLANLWDHKLNHEYPTGLFASDNFWHTAQTEYLKLTGNYRYYSIRAGGGFEDVIGHYPPLLYHISAVFSYVSGLEGYDSTLFMIFLLSCISCLLMYLIIKESIGMGVALLSAPLFIFLFSRNFYFIYLWGQYAMLAASCFVIFIWWCVSRFKLKGSFVLLAIAVTASFFSHPSEMMVALLLISTFLIFKLFAKKMKLSEIKDYSKGALIMIIVSSYYLSIFFNTLFKFSTGGKLIDLSNAPMDYLRTVYLTSFGIPSILILSGLVMSLFLLKKLNFILFASSFMLIWGHLNYLGGTFGSRSLSQRFFWPVYLAVLFGFAVYNILRLLRIKKQFIIWISIILFGVFFFAYPSVGRYSEGLMDRYHWDAIKWMNENVPDDSSVLFLYGHIYNQDGILWGLFRKTYILKANYGNPDYLEAFKDNSIKREYDILFVSESTWGLPYKKSFFKYGYHSLEQNSSYFSGKMDICSFNYHVFDKVGGDPSALQYNNVIKQRLLEVGSFEQVYDNEVLTILQNVQLDSDCLGLYENEQ
ncbi:hypothetical protein KY360_07300 [Candidatus Woesearchaeota archaeon]|nr:hypothetical protein [Candidatus Woesearchaeota archaeon]